MSYKTQKRKHGAYASRIYETTRDDSELVDGQAEKSDPSLYIQAYEADVVRGTQALAIAHSLEVERDSNGRTTRVGSALIRLGSIAVEPQDHHQTSDECRETWVDRYALNLSDT